MELKRITQSVKNLLQDESILAGLSQFMQANPEYSYNDTTSDEAYTRYEEVRGLLIQSIDSNIFDDFSGTKKTRIKNVINAIRDSLSTINQYGGNFKLSGSGILRYAQDLITNIDTLVDIVNELRLIERIEKFADYNEEIKKIRKTRNIYESIVGKVKEIGVLYDKSEEMYSNILYLHGNMASIIDESKARQEVVEKIKDEAWVMNEAINKSNQDIEEKKLKIQTFHGNVEEYEGRISKLEEDAKNIIDRKGIIDSLIESAEKALNLKSAEGISAAFSSQLVDANKKWVLRWWIVGAVIFLVTALALTIWIVTGYGIKYPNAIGSILGRIVAVTISVAGATFCAKQYIRQKNIIEDYAYKAVLAKSIVAFTNEIKKSNEDKVADYLSHVLKEIHKDPLRQRKNDDKTADLVNKIMNILPSNKN